MKRREFLSTMAAAPLIASPIASSSVLAQAPRGAAAPQRARTKIQQSVMNSVWQGLTNSFEDKCKILQRIGFKGMDLPQAAQVPMLKQYGLTPVMMTGSATTFQQGLIRKENHDRMEDALKKDIDAVAAAGCPNFIALPGERRGMSREEGGENAIAILSKVKAHAEAKGVNICMEITNSKVVADARTDQVFDHLAWGINVCKKVNSTRVKIVYDIYHVQIADGDVVRQMRENIDHICHIHVAGVPSRQEIDDTQELNYRFIANAIADLSYTGYVAHEYKPGTGRDVIKSLEQCFEIMNV